MPFMLRRLAVLAGAALSLSAAAASAQQPPPAPKPPIGEHDMMREHHGRGEHRDPAARAQHLRDVLQLRADQEPALRAYLTAREPTPGHDRAGREGAEQRGRPGGEAALTTPERLDRTAEHLARMTATFQKRAEATKAFYAALSPSQKKAFDALGPQMGEHPMMIRRIHILHDGPEAGQGMAGIKPRAD